MTRKMLGLVAVTLLVAVYGCDRPAETESASPSEPAASESSEEHADHEHPAQDNNDDMTDMEKMEAELAKLPPQDAASAEKQHVCPVSGKMLGAMGAPIKVDVNGQQVWICCEGCRDRLLANPEAYLEKLSD